MNQQIQLSVSPEQLEKLITAYVETAKINAYIAVFFIGLFSFMAIVCWVIAKNKEMEQEPWIFASIMSASLFSIILIILISTDARAFTSTAREWALIQIVSARK
jgi:formate/nitrite transporter FocA (FNT family)